MIVKFTHPNSGLPGSVRDAAIVGFDVKEIQTAEGRDFQLIAPRVLGGEVILQHRVGAEAESYISQIHNCLVLCMAANIPFVDLDEMSDALVLGGERSGVYWPATPADAGLVSTHDIQATGNVTYPDGPMWGPVSNPIMDDDESESAREQAYKDIARDVDEALTEKAKSKTAKKKAEAETEGQG